MPAKCVQPVRVGSRDQWLPESPRNSCRSAVRIEEPFVKMTDLNRVKTIDFFQEPPPNRAAENIKWVSRYRKERISTPRAQLPQVIKTFEPRDFFSADIEDDDICATQPHLRRGNKQNVHCRCIGENFRSIEDAIMQRDRKNAKSKHARTLEQLMHGIINRVFGVVECVDVKIHLDPLVFAHLSR